MMNIVKKLPKVILALTASALPATASAASDAPTITVPAQGPSLQTIVTGVTNILFWVAGIASVIVIVVAGIMFVVSAGNESTTQKARNAIIYAVVGLVVVIAAAGIVSFVLSKLG